MANRFESMDDEELKELAKEKTKKKGTFTRTALDAQRELWKRIHWDVDDVHVPNNDKDRSMEDVQYHGFEKSTNLNLY